MDNNNNNDSIVIKNNIKYKKITIWIPNIKVIIKKICNLCSY